MITTFLDHYLTDYEIRVYPEYVELTDSMIKERMGFFFDLIRSIDDNVLGSMACFYDRYGENPRCISTGSRNVISFKDDPLLKKHSKNSFKILLMPYFLFEKEGIKDLQEKIKKEDKGLIEYYQLYNKLNKKFLWRESFDVTDINKIEEELALGAKKFNNGENNKPYQKLFCLIIFNREAEISERRKEEFTNIFSLTIKEWGLDILHNEVVKHATKAAVSAIISRNHSHHIGSHVTPRTSVEQIRERLNELKTKAYYREDFPSDPYGIIAILKDRLDRYIQKKAEFTAEVATDPLLSTKSALLFDDVLIKFIENTLLIDNIGANEEVRYNPGGESKIRIHFLFNDRELVARYRVRDPAAPAHYSSLDYPYIGCEEKREIQDLVRERIEVYDTLENGCDFDPRVALPGPVGEFAIYSLLENLIRNSVKHNRDNLQPTNNGSHGLDVFLRVNDRDNEFYSLEIWDNVTDPQKMSELGEIVQESLIDPDGQLKKKWWGIAEMKIMATLLSGSLDFLDMKDNFMVTTIHWEGKDHLGYKLILMKAKEVGIVSSRVCSKLTPDVDEALKKKGIWCFPTITDFRKYLELGDRPRGFNFIAIDKPNDNASSKVELAGKEAQLPFRLLVHKEALTRAFGNTLPGCLEVSDNYFNDLETLIPDDKKMIERTWKEWVNRFGDKIDLADLTVALYLEQKRNISGNLESPSREWAELAEDKFSSDNTLALMYQTRPNATNLTPGHNSRIALYDRHGQGAIHFRHPQESILFYEAFSKNCPDFTHLFSAPRSSLAYYELLEAALLKVLILDERVAQFAGQKIKLSHAEHLFGVAEPTRLAVTKKAGIYICTHVQIDDDPPKPLHQASDLISGPIKTSISTCEGKLSLSVTDTLEPEKQLKFDAVIIHQGLMDSDGILNEPIDRKLGKQAMFLNSVKEFIPYIVVDSGRGIPPQLSEQIKFLPFSVLQDFLLSPLIAKMGLVKAIMPLTRRK